MGNATNRCIPHANLSRHSPWKIVQAIHLDTPSSIEAEEISLKKRDNTDEEEYASHYSNFDEKNPYTIIQFSDSNDESSIIIDDELKPRRTTTIRRREIITDPNLTDENTMSIIWLDPDVNESRKKIKLQKKLKAITKSLTVYNVDDYCEEHIRRLPVGEKVILIVADTISTVIIPLVHDFMQIIVIYIYPCEYIKYYKKKFKQYKKVQHFLVHRAELMGAIYDEQICYQRFTDTQVSFNIYNQKGKLSNENDRFMWMYIFMDIFFRMEHSSATAREKQALVDKLLSMYNEREDCSMIDDFNEQYQQKDAIAWYLDHGPFYKELNRALCGRNLELIVLFRFFMVDLYKTLMKTYDPGPCSYKNYRNLDPLSQKYSVYRAQYIRVNDIEQFKSSIGDFASVNQFFSTTTNRNDAFNFPSTSTEEYAGGLRNIVLEIDINPALNIRQYSNIQSIKGIRNNDDLLIIPGTIFKIKNISRDDTYVELELCSKDDEEIQNMISNWKKNIELELNQSHLYWFILETDKLNHAEQYYQLLLDYLPDGDPFITYCNHGLGNIYKKDRDYKQAIIYYKEAEQVSNDRRWTAKCHSSLADTYLSMDNEDLALHYYKEALSIYESEALQSYRNIAECYGNIGRIYEKKENYNQALSKYKKALEWNEKNCSSDSLSLITPLRNLAEICSLKNEYNKAFIHQNRALEISQKHLRPNDPELGQMYEEMGHIHEKNGNIRLALSFYHKAAEIYYYTYPQTDQHNTHIQDIIKHNNNKLKQKHYTITSSDL